MSAAARLARHRARKRAGKCVLRIVVDVHELSDMLVEAKLLPGWDAENLAAIEAATARCLEMLQRVSNARNGVD